MAEQLEAALLAIEKQHGKGSIFRVTGTEVIPDIEVIPTGVLSLDNALGVGGLPRGRITEIYGPESSGKTTIALHVIAECTKRGGVAAFIDAEHALDLKYAKALGVNLDNLLISQPDTGEQALEIVDLLVRSNEVDMIVVDSVAALVPRAELEGDVSDNQMGLQARMMSKALRMLPGVVNKSNTCLVFINQLRSKIGIVFGNPEVTSGGNALKFYASIRLDVRKGGATTEKSEDGDKKDKTGNNTKIKVVKNKLAPPLKEVETVIKFGKGIDKDDDLFNLAVDAAIIDKSGAWYEYEGQRFHGSAGAVEFVGQNHDKIRAQVLQVIKGK